MSDKGTAVRLSHYTIGALKRRKRLGRGKKKMLESFDAVVRRILGLPNREGDVTPGIRLFMASVDWDAERGDGVTIHVNKSAARGAVVQKLARDKDFKRLTKTELNSRVSAGVREFLEVVK